MKKSVEELGTYKQAKLHDHVLGGGIIKNKTQTTNGDG